MIPAGVEHFPIKAALLPGCAFEHVQGEPAQGGEVLGGAWEVELEINADLPARSIAAAEPVKASDPIDEFKKDPLIQKALELFKAEIQAES